MIILAQRTGLLTLAALMLIRTGAAAPRIQLLTQFDEAASAPALREMEQELDVLYREVPASILWQEITGQPFDGTAARIVFVHFEGNCRAVTVPPRQHVAGVTLASVSRVDGQMLPNLQVDCDAVAGYLWPAMTGSERAQGNVVFGRALARVLAHELYHYLTGTAKHTHSAIFRASIAPTALFVGRLKFGDDEIAALKKALAAERLPLGTI